MEEEFPGIPAIDRIANGEEFLMLKAALPYLEPSLQQPLAVYIKVMELQNILQFYRQPSDMSICSTPPKSAPSDMLQDISRYCAPAKREKLQQFLQMMQAMELMSAFQNQDVPSNLAESLLTPEQMELFQTYQSMFSST